VPIFGLLWSWAIGHSAKQIAYAGAFLAIGLFAAYEIHHQRAIGRDECEAEHEQADAARQAAADKAAAGHKADIEKITAPLPAYLQTYNAPPLAAPDCAPVTYIRKKTP
jgi:hypothetical protein